jgi:hypothetical protein
VRKNVGEKEVSAALRGNFLVARDADDFAAEKVNEVANKVNFLTVPIHFDEWALEVNREVLQGSSRDGKALQVVLHAPE